MPLIELEDVTKAYRIGDVDVFALNGVTVDFERGEITAIMGHSGSGKSTLMNLIGCLDVPSTGAYRLEGENVGAWNDSQLAQVRNRKIGFVFQTYNLLPRLTALDNVQLALLYGKWKNARSRSLAALEAVGLRQRAGHKPAQLSGGEQQRVGIARALVKEPVLLLADEPTGNLDSHSSNEIIATLQGLNRAHGVTIVLVTHESDIAQHAHRIVSINDGRVVGDERVARPLDRRLDRGAGRRERGMSPFAVLKTAWASIGSNKLRTGLTLLGMIIGVAAVISLMAIGRGTQNFITSRIEALGSELLFVRPLSTGGGQFGGGGEPANLTLDDAYALLDPLFAPSVLAVAPELQSNGQVVAPNANTFAQITGVTRDWTDVRNFTVALGETVSPAHVLNGSRVAVLGSDVAETLFGTRDPVGQTIRLNEKVFTVIGVLESKGAGEDRRVLVPITTAADRLASERTSEGDVNVESINVKATGPDTVDSAMREAATVLRVRHRITDEDDFIITNQQETLDALNETTETFALFLGAIAGISLLVGGIGIMNIMLVSVTERTREIGDPQGVGRSTERRTHAVRDRSAAVERRGRRS